MDILRTSLAVLYGAVNKRFLSTRETRELVLENVGFGLNPGVELAPRAVSFPTGETARRARTCRMWRIRAAVTASAAVKIMGVGIWYANSMAPRHGHVSNFCGPNGTVIEPVNAERFQKDRPGLPSIVHTGPPAWTRLELWPPETGYNRSRKNNRLRRHYCKADVRSRIGIQVGLFQTRSQRDSVRLLCV